VSSGVVVAVLALGSALAFGASAALQHGVMATVPDADGSGATLLLRVIRRPRWLAGLAVSFAGFALHAAAVRSGALLVVQPLLGMSLVFALLFVAAAEGEALVPREWAAVGATVLALAVFLAAVGLDTETRADGAALAWLVSGAITVAVVAAAVAAAFGAEGRGRAWRLGLAAGVANGYVALLTKAFAERAARGPSVLVHSWPLYALILAGVPALVLVQIVYRAGYLRVSLPVITVVDPAIAIAVERAVFRGHVSLTAGRGVIAVAGAAVAAVALWTLAKNPRLTALEAPA
jgi:hypothetical protein